MKYYLPFILAITLALSYQSYVLADTQDADTASLKSALNQFFVEFHKALLKYNNGNIVSTPISAATIVSLLANGADGHSKEELIQAIHVAITDNNFQQKYQDMLSNLNSATGSQFNSASSLFIEDQFDINKSFQDISENTFQSKVQKIDLENTNAASETINDWFKQKTGGKTTNIVTPENLTNAKMVIANSVYFKSNWKQAFSANMIDVPFHVSPNNDVSVPMMCLSKDCNHGQILGDTVLYIELPLQSADGKNEISVFLFIPNDIFGLDAMYEKMQNIDFTKLNVSTHAVNLCMPKLELTSKLNLIPAFESMGIHDIFGNSANFGNIADSNNLKISQIIQETTINIDETGVQAGSSGANVHDAAHHHHEAVHGAHHVHQIRLDRPSVAVLYAKTAGVPLLSMQIKNPHTHTAH